MSLTPDTQRAVAAALVDDADVVAIAAAVAGGPAVFAPGGAFANVYPRITLQVPQRIDRSTACGPGAADMIVTVHSWAKGPDCTLVAGALADAAVAALSHRLAIAGHRVSSWMFEGSRPVGDPQPDIEHIVSTFRYSAQPTG